eukprot:4650574-Amphidinium_carterae.3
MAVRDAMQGESYKDKDASERTRSWLKFAAQLSKAKRNEGNVPDRAWKKLHEVVDAFQVGEDTWTLPGLAAAWNSDLDHWQRFALEITEWQLKKSQRRDYARRKAEWKKFCVECLQQGGKEGCKFLRKKAEADKDSAELGTTSSTLDECLCAVAKDADAD